MLRLLSSFTWKLGLFFPTSTLYSADFPSCPKFARVEFWELSTTKRSPTSSAREVAGRRESRLPGDLPPKGLNDGVLHRHVAHQGTRLKQQQCPKQQHRDTLSRRVREATHGVAVVGVLPLGCASRKFLSARLHAVEASCVSASARCFFRAALSGRLCQPRCSSLTHQQRFHFFIKKLLDGPVRLDLALHVVWTRFRMMFLDCTFYLLCMCVSFPSFCL